MADRAVLAHAMGLPLKEAVEHLLARQVRISGPWAAG